VGREEEVALIQRRWDQVRTDMGQVVLLSGEALEPNKPVQWRCLGDHPAWIDTEVIFDLTPDTESTTMRFSHLKWKSSDGMLARCSYDWARYLTSLKSYLEIGTGMSHSG
jgi:hypothetical protein